ncbi:MAG TPA: lipoyl(octanoyl) transferase LipB [Casimicrobiaceae bacterium]|nr:lipoyl(octanoyl) transferase LipB [Casimicrobiaceae bacterium]
MHTNGAPDLSTRRVAARPATLRTLGLTGYEATWRAMQAFTDARSAATADEIWLTEHEPVYTLGLAGRREHLLRSNAIPVIKADRGGQVTYHGPGQVVAYTLFDLRRARLGVREMVRRIEGAVITWLATFGIAAFGKISAPGVYVERDGGEAKIAALGLRVRNGCTYHGVAVNVDMNLTPFADIDPCGYPGLAVTQLADFGVRCTVNDAGRALAPLLAAAMDTRG